MKRKIYLFILLSFAVAANAQVFEKDKAGYYQTYNGVKWYFASSSNKNLRIEATLLKSGKVVYCPVILCSRSEQVATDRIALKNGGNTKEITIHWILNEDVAYRGRIDSQCSVKTSGDIYYLDYLTMHSDVGDVNDFLRTAKEAKQYKAVILKSVLRQKQLQYSQHPSSK